MIDPGQMNHRVDVLRHTEMASDALNVPAMAWPRVRTVWAAIKPLQGQQRFGSDQDFAVRTVVFKTHFFEVLEADRLTCEGRIYKITGIAELGFREGLEIAAEWLEVAQ